MANAYFQFQRFTVYHDRCAMKVGTDGVLLGTWADVAPARRVLDVGTGTGLIALILAQRGQALIDAIDIDADACSQAAENVRRSPFADRVRVWHQPLERYSPPEPIGYDLIVSNPPYFDETLKSPDRKRNLARHADTLPLEDLLLHAKRLLAPEGRLALILPFDQLNRFMAKSQEADLFLRRLTRVIPIEGGRPKRLLAELTLVPTPPPAHDELVIENADHHYTEAFVAMIRDFYLRWRK